ncbi:hypothetical protein WISP_04110 [Willisornis vidua]|uniref:Envelope polyprotein n=1 Tax=Willisornis vidua TaxID=1566151 RepID=A0ABQ9DZ21_9PASS|nr:hypothetical protein WISP_04110 [Willisornis vidua]
MGRPCTITHMGQRPCLCFYRVRPLVDPVQVRQIPSQGHPGGMGDVRGRRGLGPLPAFRMMILISGIIVTVKGQDTLALWMRPTKGPSFSFTIGIQTITIESFKNPAVPTWALSASKNIWIGLAQSLNTDSICLTTTDLSNPFKTCLVGIPWSADQWSQAITHYNTYYNKPVGCAGNPFAECTPNDKVKERYQGDRLEELEILGTLQSPMCLHFRPKQQDKIMPFFNVTSQGAYSKFSFWCKEEVPFSIPPTLTPTMLPKGFFLLCGKRAWKAIPSMAIEGPCTIGKLTLYNPAKFMTSNGLQLKDDVDTSDLPTHVHRRSLRCWRAVMMRGWGNPIKRHVGFGGAKCPVVTREEEIAPEEGFAPAPPRVRVTPELPPPQIWGDHHPLQKMGHLNEFIEGCDSDMEFWSPGKNLAGSLFIPATGTKRALDLLTKMGCWLAREANATSQASEELLEDTQNNKKVLFQNRAAIDFLLLVNGHGCQEFEGLCCMNFSDNSCSIHSHISQLKSMVHQLKEEKGFSFDDLFSWLPFKGWSETVKKIVVISLVVVIVVVMFMCVLPCFFQCLRTCRATSSPQAFPAQQQQNKKGADVGGDEEFVKWQRYYKRWVDEDAEIQESREPMRYMDISPV